MEDGAPQPNQQPASPGSSGAHDRQPGRMVGLLLTAFDMACARGEREVAEPLLRLMEATSAADIDRRWDLEATDLDQARARLDGLPGGAPIRRA